MKTPGLLVFYVSLFVTIFMGMLAYLSYRRGQKEEFFHLTEFWCSLAINGAIMWIFSQKLPQYLALAMLGWLWPLRTFRLYLEDISGKKLVEKWKYILLGLGVAFSVILVSFGADFSYYSLPFAAAIAVVGITNVLSCIHHIPRKEITLYHWASFALMEITFIACLIFPFWIITPENAFYGPLVVLALILVFAGVAHSTYKEVLGRRYDQFLEEAVKERSDRLLGQSKYSELGMMSAGIAHEINNPLAVIQARTTQLLRIYREPGKEKELGEGLQQIFHTSERIARIIQGIRDFVHHDEKGPMVEVELQTLVDDVLAFCGQRMKNHGVSLRFYGLEGYVVYGNKIQLEQVLLNLLNNSFDAIEYLPDKWIEISAHRTGNMVQIYVKDSGGGIPSEVATRIMEPFYSTKEMGKGTGLGLSLARGIVEKHGGSLQYLSNTSHTTFMVEIPVRHPEGDGGRVSFH